ncbi:Tegument protein VP22 [Cacatuid alphaherpesvirus 2]|uniref:Tegument protein VP22 n=1 Tax=Cacatuid alphaherpesvirus 2 TaxID=2604840 RepID=A0A5B9R2Q1_9ALPH|nr:Tegument protein VP22 [Cacatuid alphaherpesvirus 2]QEG54093.1 Tegument protein VP22 [Cacatuid alphaherpesvirus 2]
MSYYGDVSETKKTSKKSPKNDSSSSTPPPGAVRGRVLYPPEYDPSIWFSRREQNRRSSTSSSSSQQYSYDEEEDSRQANDSPVCNQRQQDRASAPTRRKTDRTDEKKSSWNIDNQCSSLVKRLSIAKGFGPSSTPASDQDRWHTTTIPANRSAFVQAVAVTAMAQAEMAAREAWEKYKPRNNADLERLVETLEIKIVVKPGRSLWDVASNVAKAIRKGSPITPDLLDSGKAASVPRRRPSSRRAPKRDEDEDKPSSKTRSSSSRRKTDKYYSPGRE